MAVEEEEEPELMLPQDADGAPMDDEVSSSDTPAPSPPFPLLSRWMQASWDWVQNAKYVINRRQMVTAGHLIQLQLNQPPCPVCILGRKYDSPQALAPAMASDGTPSISNAVGRNLGLRLGSGGEALIHSNPLIQEWHDAIAAEVESRVWCTYRTGFSPLVDSSLTTDAGWGCMIRSGQMLLCQGFIMQTLGREWRFDKTKIDPRHVSILRLFLDRDSDESPFSIHSVVRFGAEQGILPGKWWGPYSLCRVFDRINRARASRMSNDNGDGGSDGAVRMHIVAAGGGGGVPELCTSEIESLCRASEEEGKGEQGDSSSSPDWTPILILVPLTLGLGRNINPLYIPSIISILQAPQSLGFIGGKPGASLYFFGYQNQHFLSLDPHRPQAAIPSLGDNECHDPDALANAVSTYHSSSFRLVPFTSIDPSLAFGFLCKTRDEFSDLCTRISSLNSRYPVLTVTQSPPKAYATDFASEDGEDSNSNGRSSQNNRSEAESEESDEEWLVMRGNG